MRGGAVGVRVVNTGGRLTICSGREGKGKEKERKGKGREGKGKGKERNGEGRRGEERKGKAKLI